MSAYRPELFRRAKELRRDMTREERRLWYEFLRDHPQHFVRQKVMGKYILDFYCAKAKLAVELDGSQHFTDSGEAYDRQRSADLEKQGIQVLRFSNDLCQRNFPELCQQIDRAIKEKLER